jgi:hypothetical protein
MSVASRRKSGGKPPHSKIAMTRGLRGHGAQQCCAPTKEEKAAAYKEKKKLRARGID